MSGITDWLLLRGLSREKRQWGRFPRVLETRLRGSKAHLLDHAGIGAAQHRVAPSTVEGMVDDLRDRFRRLRDAHPDGRWGILGVSLGGMVALSWLARYPGDFAVGVVVNSSAANLSTPLARLRPANLPQLLRVAREKDPVLRELRLLDLTTARHGQNTDIATEWAGYLAETPLAPGAFVRQLIAGMRFRAPRHLTHPVLFVSGAADRFVDPACTDRLAARFEAAHEVHPTAGHDLPLDEPEWLAERLEAFDAEHASARAS